MYKTTDFCIQALLTSAPDRGIPVEAWCDHFPIFSESDFVHTASFTGMVDTPVLLSFATYYDFFGKLLELLLEQSPSEVLILLQMNMPGGIRMPEILLDERVFLVQDVTSELKKIGAQTPLVSIEHGLIRHDQERGDNSLKISFLNFPSAVDKPRIELFLQNKSFKLKEPS